MRTQTQNADQPYDIRYRIQNGARTCIVAHSLEPTRRRIDSTRYRRARERAHGEDGEEHTQPHADVVPLAHLDQRRGEHRDEHAGRYTVRVGQFTVYELGERGREREGDAPVYKADSDVPALVRDERPDVGENARGRRRGDHNVQGTCAMLAHGFAKM